MLLVKQWPIAWLSTDYNYISSAKKYYNEYLMTELSSIVIDNG